MSFSCSDLFLFSILQKAKRLQSKKQEGNECFSSGKYQEAFDIYTEALTIDPCNKSTNAKLYYNRALVGSKVCTWSALLFMMQKGDIVYMYTVNVCNKNFVNSLTIAQPFSWKFSIARAGILYCLSFLTWLLIYYMTEKDMNVCMLIFFEKLASLSQSQWSYFFSHANYKQKNGMMLQSCHNTYKPC